ncbi:MAG: acetoacetate decarboxylase family protein [Gammaproteobacteria bacterium]
MQATLSTGDSLTFPVASRELCQFLVGYRARVADVRRLLPPDLQPEDHGYGLTLLYLYCLDATDSDFGPYRELAVLFPVREPYFGQSCYHYYANPISTPRARQVAVELWGHPSELADVAMDHDARGLRCHVAFAGHTVLELRAAPGPAGPGEDRGLLSTAGDYPRRRRSDVYRYAQVARGRLREEQPRHVQIAFGSHPLGELLRSLVVDSQPVMSIHYTGSTIWSGPRYSDLYQVRH